MPFKTTPASALLKPYRIIGLDPGLALTGYAILEKSKAQEKKILEVGVIRTPAQLSLPERLKEIHHDLQELLKNYQPQYAAIEQIFFSKNTKTAIQVAQARGVILASLANFQLEIHEFSPTALKLALTGHGQADKQAIQKMLCLELNLKQAPKPDDAADALSLALSLAFQLQ